MHFSVHTQLEIQVQYIQAGFNSQNPAWYRHRAENPYCVNCDPIGRPCFGFKNPAGQYKSRARTFQKVGGTK